jgi:peptidyl-prolyl cis-trans isomerase D
MMLDKMRKHSRSFIIYIFFGIIIAVFVVNFGPQSAGCTSSTVYAGKVEGRTISPSQFNYALSASGIMSRFSNLPESLVTRMRGQVMDQILVRELLADDALEHGFRIPTTEINDMLVKGRFLALGQAQPMILNDDGKFDYDLFSRFVRYRWGLTVKKFKEEQRRELLAYKMKRVLRSAVKVTEDEVKSDFVHKNTTVELNYVRFSPIEYRAMVQVTPDKIRAFLAANKKRVKEYYDTNKTAYEKLPKQVQLQIVRVDAGDDEAAARKQAEAALARVKGGEDFAAVARELSDDPSGKIMGGNLGWRNADSPGLGPKADKLVAGLKRGQISELRQDDRGFLFVKLLGRRSGTLTLAQVQEEIAVELLKGDEAVKAARQEAQRFIDRARAGEKLSDIFTTDEDVSLDKKDDADTPATAEEALKKITGKDGDEAEPEQPADKVPRKSPLKLQTSAAFSRSGRDLIPGIGVSKKLNKAVFELKQGEIVPHPVKVGQMVYLVAVKDRQSADLGEFTKNKRELTEQFLDQKAGMLLLEYARKRCLEARDGRGIKVNPGILVTPGFAPKKGEPLPQYTPCDSLRGQPAADPQAGAPPMMGG